jgi:hypothetical protein
MWATLLKTDRSKQSPNGQKFAESGTDVMIFKIVSPKKIAKKLAFFTPSKAKLCKILIITLVFEKNANCFAENWQKKQKILIITLVFEKNANFFAEYWQK